MWTSEQATAALYVFASEIGVSVTKLRSSDRATSAVAARQAAAWMLRRAGGLKVSVVGVMLNRDHTTICASVRRMDVALCAVVTGDSGRHTQTHQRGLLAMRRSLLVVPPASGYPLPICCRCRERCRTSGHGGPHT